MLKFLQIILDKILLSAIICSVSDREPRYLDIMNETETQASK